jgi:hypothetical protein
MGIWGFCPVTLHLIYFRSEKEQYFPKSFYLVAPVRSVWMSLLFIFLGNFCLLENIK